VEAAIKRPQVLAFLLIIFAISLRLLPHPANFAPVGAVCLFGAMVLPRRVGWWLPLLIMGVSDVFLGFYSSLPFTWFSFLAVAGIGLWLSKWQSWWRVPVGVASGALAFFIISNFGVWAMSGLYSHSLSGLVQCYGMAIPFFRVSLLSDVCYSAILFGLYAFALHYQQHRLENRLSSAV
jgi:hypothetical protein